MRSPLSASVVKPQAEVERPWVLKKRRRLSLLKTRITFPQQIKFARENDLRLVKVVGTVIKELPTRRMHDGRRCGARAVNNIVHVRDIKEAGRGTERYLREQKATTKEAQRKLRSVRKDQAAPTLRT